jgi:hypothetical protein
MLKRSFAIALVFFLFLTFTVQAQTPPDAGEAIRAANLRGGPGTNFPVVGSAKAGDVLPILACNDDCTWYQIGEDQWIAAFLVTPVTASPTSTTPASGDPITLVSWNVESGGALQNVVANRLTSFEEVDIWGLSEVSAVDAEAYEFGTEEGEGADYDSLLGTTGRADRLLPMWDAVRFERVNGGELLTIGESGRAPLWVQLRERSSGQEFIVMVNHLHRSNDASDTAKQLHSTLRRRNRRFLS